MKTKRDEVSVKFYGDIEYLNVAKNLLCSIILGFTLIITCAKVNADPAQTNMPTFVPYYPAGCSITTQATSTSCTCIQDKTTKDVWYTSVNNTPMHWGNAYAWASGLNKNALHPSGICGITAGWRLPTLAQLKILSNFTPTSLVSNGFSAISLSKYWGGVCHNSNWCNSSDSMGLFFYFITLSSSNISANNNIDVSGEQLEGTDSYGAIAVVSPTGINRPLY